MSDSEKTNPLAIAEDIVRVVQGASDDTISAAFDIAKAVLWHQKCVRWDARYNPATSSHSL